jgi:type IV secretory pathway VirB10-like protein
MRNQSDRERVERELYERDLRRERDIARSNASASTGMLIGVFVIAIFGLIAAFFLLNQRSETQIQAPEPPEVNVEIPEPQAPPPPQVEAPDININVPEPELPEPQLTEPQLPSGDILPEQAPTSEQAPAGESTQPAPAQP